MTESQRESVPRNDNGELHTALAFLDFQRESLVKKTEGLADEEMRRRLVPTETTLLGMIQHMTVGEQYWFAHPGRASNRGRSAEPALGRRARHH